MKRQKTCEEDPTPPTSQEYDIKNLLDNKENNLEVASVISSGELIDLINGNLKEFVNMDRPLQDEEVDGATTTLCLTKAVIDSISQSDVIDLVKQKLLARLS